MTNDTAPKYPPHLFISSFRIPSNEKGSNRFGAATAYAERKNSIQFEYLSLSEHTDALARAEARNQKLVEALEKIIALDLVSVVDGFLWKHQAIAQEALAENERGGG